MRNYRSFKQTVKRLEEVAVSCRGVERVQLLKRWLMALKETENYENAPADEKSVETSQASAEPITSPRKAPLVSEFRLQYFIFFPCLVKIVSLRRCLLRRSMKEY